MTAQGKRDALRECIADWREQAAAEENCQRSGGNPKGATAYRHCADDLESTLAEMQIASPTPSADLVKEARELDAKATPGPWRSMRDGNQYVAGACVHASRIEEVPRPWNPRFVKPAVELEHVSRFLDADADLIACYRTLCPQLADALEKAEGEVAALMEVRECCIACLSSGVPCMLCGRAVEGPVVPPIPSADLLKEARGMLKKGAVDDFTPARVAEIEGFAIDQTDGLVMDLCAEVRKTREMASRLADALEKAEGEVRAVTASQDHLLVTVQRALRETIQRAEAAEKLVEAATLFEFNGPGGKFFADGGYSNGAWFVLGIAGDGDSEQLGKMTTRDEAIAAARKLAMDGKGE